MASVLTIRKLPEDVQAPLRERAAAAGRNVEAEAREIPTSAFPENSVVITAHRRFRSAVAHHPSLVARVLLLRDIVRH